jgi:hypothetical protein
MAKIPYNDKLSYEIFDDGYDIFNVDLPQPEVPWISQREPYSHLFVSGGTYEENALAHLKSIVGPEKPKPDIRDVFRADLDYLALMMDVDLPSQEVE